MRSSFLRSDVVVRACSTSADLWEIESLMNIGNYEQYETERFHYYYYSIKYLASIQTINHNSINPDYILQCIIKERVAFKHSIEAGKELSNALHR